MTPRLSRREREVLAAIGRQNVWPVATTTGWAGDAADKQWVPATRKVLAYLARLGLVVDESTSYMPGDVVGMRRAARYRITEEGRKALPQ